MPKLVIPDTHLKTNRADAIIDQHSECDKIYFLGDYFHDFNDDDERNRRTAQWLAKKIEDQEKRLKELKIDFGLLQKTCSVEPRKASSDNGDSCLHESLLFRLLLAISVSCGSLLRPKRNRQCVLCQGAQMVSNLELRIHDPLRIRRARQSSSPGQRSGSRLRS